MQSEQTVPLTEDQFDAFCDRIIEAMSRRILDDIEACFAGDKVAETKLRNWLHSMADTVDHKLLAKVSMVIFEKLS